MSTDLLSYLSKPKPAAQEESLPEEEEGEERERRVHVKARVSEGRGAALPGRGEAGARLVRNARDLPD